MERIKLANHIKRGATFYTPLMDPKGLGANISLTSWAKCWLPEYLWIGQIIKEQGRKQGLENLYHIINELKSKEIAMPQLSRICMLEEDKQVLFWTIVTRYTGKKILQPLTVVLTPDINAVFYNYFFDFSIDIDSSIGKLMEVIKECNTFHDELTTDICFIVVWFYVLSGTLHISSDLSMLPDALTGYYKNEHRDEIMKCYRPIIRSTFQGLCELDSNKVFSANIWRVLGELSPCEPYKFTWRKNEKMDYYNIVKKTMEYIDATNENKKLDSKYTVIMGITCYIFKLYRELVEQNLQNSLSGRIIFRSMVDSYINLKYLMVKENTMPDIYDRYKVYGYGKYKLVMAKLREDKYTVSDESMMDQKLLELIVNEDANEVFMNIDIGFFDSISIKNKFIECDEALLYEIYYEYTTNYTHGFWGAIRESSMLLCNNPAHGNHSIPDFSAEQESRSALNDCNMIMQKTLKCISSYVGLPDFYTKSYMED